MLTTMPKTAKDALFEEAERALQLGDLATAISKFREIVKASPENMVMRNMLGDLYMRTNNWVEAMEVFNSVADYYVANDYPLKAIAMYKKLYRLIPSEYQIAEKIAELYATHNHITDARVWYRTARDEYRNSGNVSQALAAFSKMVELDPDNIELQMQLAQDFINEGERECAGNCHQRIGQTLLKQERYAEAIQSYQTAMTFAICRDAAIKSYFKSLTDVVNLNAVIETIQKLLSDSPKNPILLTLLGQTYLKAHMPDAARTIFNDLSIGYSSFDDSLLAVADEFVRMGNYQEAFTIIEKSLSRLRESHQELKALMSINLLFELDCKDLNILKRVVEIYAELKEITHYIAALERLVDVAQQAGEKVTAIDALRRLIKLEPFQEAHKERLCQLMTEPSDSMIPLEVSDDISSADTGKTNFIEPAELGFEIILDEDVPPSAITDSEQNNISNSFIKERVEFELCLKTEWQCAMLKSSSIAMVLILVSQRENCALNESAIKGYLNYVGETFGRELMRDGDMIARYDKDKLVILLPGVKENCIGRILNRLNTRLSLLNSLPVNQSVSDKFNLFFGFAAIVPARFSLADSLINSAQQSLHKATVN